MSFFPPGPPPRNERFGYKPDVTLSAENNDFSAEGGESSEQSANSTPNYTRTTNRSRSRSRSPTSEETSPSQPYTSHVREELLSEPTQELNILDLPIRVTKYIFTCLPLEEMTTCMLVCSAWFNVLSDENMIVWKQYCKQRMNAKIFEAEYLKLCPTFKSKLRALNHTWSAHDKSPNVSIVDDFILKRNQVPQSSDGCRAKIGFREGRHVWQIVVYDPLGSAAAVGVATRSTVMTMPGYTPLLGHDRHSWGWNLVENIVYHKGDSHSYYPKDPKIKYKVGDILHVLLDCEDRTLSFKKNGDYLGVAFRDLPTPKKELYPSFCAVYGGSRASMVYLGMLS